MMLFIITSVLLLISRRAVSVKFQTEFELLYFFGGNNNMWDETVHTCHPYTEMQMQIETNIE